MRDNKCNDTNKLIEVRRSKVHGLGVFANSALPAGADLGVYEGRRYSLKQAMRMAWNPSVTYLFELSDGTYIDGSRGGNGTRHFNHACDPNCEAFEETLPDGSLTIRFRTTTAVAAGEELFLDYQLGVAENADPAQYLCRCGTRACRGTLFAQPA
ncbi:SET domain-containing protein [Ideonella sp.]|uniref:SET domain-containing protein n=1 Tax=Ideonella sp. TaxID=1929293 RepID=UPI0035B29F09